MGISERAKNIEPSATFTINAKANQMIASGENVLKFGIGEPDFNTPDNIKEAGKKAIDSNKSRYTAAAGVPELLKAVSEKFKRENGLDYTPEQISCANGAKHSLFNICLAVLNPGDEAIIPVPAWFSYWEQVKLTGGKPVFVNTDEKFQVKADLIREKITEKTKLIFLNSPSNPTGAVIEKSDLKEIADLAVEKDIYIISDEVYEHLIYDGLEHLPTASLSKKVYEKTFTVNAISKTYAMTGWRLGYAAGPVEVINAMNQIQGQTTSNPSSISQYAAIEALQGQQESVGKMKEQFDKRRKETVKLFNEIPGINCVMPRGAFYAMPDVSQLFKGKIKNSVDFSSFLLDEARVAVIPGEVFLADNCIRFSYASSFENIVEGIGRIADAVKKM